MEDINKIIETKAKYDKHGQIIWGVCKNGHHQRIADLRGWGAIQNMFKDKKGIIDVEKAAEFQDYIGEWIVDAINTKLEIERNSLILEDE